MTARLLVLVPLTIITFVFSVLWLDYGVGFPWLFGICTVIGIYGIVRAIANHCRFKLVNNILVLESPLKNAYRIDLNTVAEWRELGYNIRGQRRKTIILLFDQKEKVVIDNSEYEIEFDELLTYLSQNNSEQKWKSASQ
jgi:hypothetical protein